MSKNLISNEKQLVSGIKKDVENFSDCANKAIRYAISAGEKLIKLKEITKHGQWESRLKNDFQDVFGVRQAQRFMEIAESKYLAIELNSDKEMTIEQTIKALSSATPEQLAKAEQLKIEEESKRQQAEAERQRKAEEQTKKQTPKEPDIIEGEFTEVKPEPKKPEVKPEPIPEENPIDLLQETITELQDANGELLKEIESVTRVLDSNDQTGKALAEAKRFREENRVLKERINGLQSECNEAKRAAKYWKGKFEKLEKETGHAEV